MMLSKWICAAVAAVALAGCASAPPIEQMKAETAGYQLPKAPDPGKAMVYVVRPSQVGGLIRFNVFVDNQEDASEVGYTRGSQYIYLSLPPGPHKIYSKAENWAEIDVDVKAGEIAFLQQEATMGVLMARNNLFRVDDVQGKYWVKNLELGTLLKGK